MLLETKIAEHVARETRESVSDVRVRALTGGACQDNFEVELTLGGPNGAREKLALRSDARTSLPGSLDRTREFHVICAAVKVSVKTPRARWLGKDLVRDGGTAFFLDWAEGEAIGRKVVASKDLAGAREVLAGELARELAKIHSIVPSAAPEIESAKEASAPGFDPARMRVARMRQSIDGLHEPRPAIELVHRWLRENAPTAGEIVLCHGDFRVGNFLVTPAGLSAILDWEFSHFGSPYADLTWISMRDWRFGKLNLPIGGFSERAPFYEAYEKASGRTLDPKLLYYWEILGNLEWAIGSVYQGERYVYGGEEEFELVAIGRRAAEMEWEALRLIEKGSL